MTAVLPVEKPILTPVATTMNKPWVVGIKYIMKARSDSREDLLEAMVGVVVLGRGSRHAERQHQEAAHENLRTHIGSEEENKTGN